ncbi:hypothetical protein Tcan_03733 [Toxocara canis]|uniref:Uncharacterized protein n=1 Tax=Toxocara canis TaxID=6265 RepID=A0A0B2UYY6_TOXCA|nr:hypothetical protein Tcan_03733 [Toxocara canis]
MRGFRKQFLTSYARGCRAVTDRYGRVHMQLLAQVFSGKRSVLCHVNLYSGLADLVLLLLFFIDFCRCLLLVMLFLDYYYIISCRYILPSLAQHEEQISPRFFTLEPH